MREHGPWKIKLTEQMYSDPWVQLFRDQVIRPDGLPGTYATVLITPGVCVIAVDEDWNVHLTREFHYAVGRVTIEGVSGGIEPNEEPLAAAKRELAEELGIEAEKWTHFGSSDPFTAAVRSPVQLYIAQQLSFCEKAPEGTERIEHVVMSLDEAVQAVRDGVITHAPTCVALLRMTLDQSFFSAPPASF
jgi:ADP-ribose pyrophosphatase